MKGIEINPHQNVNDLCIIYLTQTILDYIHHTSLDCVRRRQDPAQWYFENKNSTLLRYTEGLVNARTQTAGLTGHSLCVNHLLGIPFKLFQKY